VALFESNIRKYFPPTTYPDRFESSIALGPQMHNLIGEHKSQTIHWWNFLLSFLSTLTPHSEIRKQLEQYNVWKRKSNWWPRQKGKGLFPFC
jgi:hypothetical protein